MMGLHLADVMCFENHLISIGPTFLVFLREVKRRVFTLSQCLGHQILTLPIGQGSLETADPPLEFCVAYILGSQGHHLV